MLPPAVVVQVLGARSTGVGSPRRSEARSGGRRADRHRRPAEVVVSHLRAGRFRGDWFRFLTRERRKTLNAGITRVAAASGLLH
jgi:hypothetical protein